MTTADQPPPVVCTLTTKARARQQLEWGDLAALALSRTHLTDGIHTTFPLALRAHVEDLAARENACCGSWLATRVWTDDVVHLELTTRATEGLQLIRSIAGAGPDKDTPC